MSHVQSEQISLLCMKNEISLLEKRKQGRASVVILNGAKRVTTCSRKDKHIQILSIFFKELLSSKNNKWFEMSLPDLLSVYYRGSITVHILSVKN